jgi:hypothetical protein
MKYNKRDKVFKTKVRLAKNQQAQFRYLIDDQFWENDPQADKYQPNEFGTENSVVII